MPIVAEEYPALITERIDKPTHVLKGMLVLKPSFPDAIKIELAGRCNYNCSFCANKKA